MSSPADTDIMKMFSYEKGNKIIIASIVDLYYLDMNTEVVKEFEGLEYEQFGTYNCTNCDLWCPICN